MVEIKIDKGVPMPAAQGKWPWHKMGVGDSFFAAGYALSGSRERPDGMRWFTVSAGERTVPGSKWSARTVTEKGVKGVRVWRVK